MKRHKWTKKGESPVVSAFIVIILLMFSLAIIEGVRLYGWEKMIQRHLQSAVLAQVTENYQEVYSGIKKKSSSAFTFNEVTNQFELNIDEGRVLEDLSDDLGLSVSGGVASGYLIEISNLQLTLTSAPKEIDSAGVFETTASVDIKIYYQTIFKQFPPYQHSISIPAKYIKKF